MGLFRSLRAGPWARRLARVALLGFLTAILAELAIRWLLFSPPPPLAAVAKRLRHAHLYAAPWEDDYWRLQHLFRNRARARRPPFHPLLGWVTPKVDPVSLEHTDHSKLSGRRPMLLYGDSFAACVTSDSECWQGLLEESAFGAQFRLLNFGTGGYGLDQTFLLARASLDTHLSDDPLVVVGILIDDDLDRTILRMRGWPKPFLVLNPAGDLEPEAPVAVDESAFLAEHPVQIRSYLWRYLICGSGLIPGAVENRITARGAALTEIRAQSRRILEALAGELQGAAVEHFVVLFHGPGAGETAPGVRRHGGWRETLLVEELDRLGLPYVLSSPELAAGRDSDFFVGGDPPLAGHYTASGNRAVFGAFLRGLEGRFDGAVQDPSKR